MTVFRWAVVALMAGVAGSTSSTTTASPPVATVAPQHEIKQESEPRVEIGAAVLTIYDETGRVISVE